MLLAGKPVAEALQQQLIQSIAALPAEAPRPRLVVMLVGDDPASQVYVKRKHTVATQLGMASELIHLPQNTSASVVLDTLARLNADPNVHAILIQLPLPAHLPALDILAAIAPHKDVDGFHPHNLGTLLSGGTPLAVPCTPAGVMALLESAHVPLKGAHVVVVGRSNIVGKPVSQLLLRENATVTICHSATRNLPAITQQADVLITAVGRPGLIGADDVRPGVVVIDVGINRLPNGKLTGDVDFDAVSPKASLITPVPGGVGPMTIAMLMKNTWQLYQAALH